MPELLGYLLLFTGIGAGFVLVNLMAGKFIRPAKMNAEKGTIYECGEPTVGSAWVQFDLRFYVVALLFVIFDVEMAFFFPWAVVFGRATEIADPAKPTAERAVLVATLPQLEPQSAEKVETLFREHPDVEQRSMSIASSLAWVAFIDILFFFGVLLVAFAYLWKRGDLDWVRSTAAQKAMARPREQLVLLTKD
jgi:NADH-quinone oxidoreductase subunit A